MASMFTIGKLAQATGIPERTIRYYEAVGALPRPGRTASGYRQYSEQAVVRLQFLRRARRLGLSLRELRELCDAVEEDRSATVRPRLSQLVRTQLETVRRQIADLDVLRRDLEAVLARLSDREPRRRPLAPNGTAPRACRCLDVDPPEPHR